MKKHDDSIIPLEKFICKAKLDEDGTIIYNISLNFECDYYIKIIFLNVILNAVNSLFEFDTFSELVQKNLHF